MLWKSKDSGRYLAHYGLTNDEAAYVAEGVKQDLQYLEHYGVKGQKPGVRRYQNEDGSLTSEGREHYGVGDPRQPGQGPQQASVNKRSEAAKAAFQRRAEEVKNMSTREKVRRMNRNQYQMARNRGAGRLSAFIQTYTPLGVINSSRRAQKKRQETLARKRAERNA